jgi:hypothetical protein
MQVYSQLEVASLENLASDPTLLPEGRIWFNTTSNQVKIRRNGATTVVSFAEFTQIRSYANQAALPAAASEGLLAYLQDSKKLFFDNGTAWAPVVGIVGNSSTASQNIKLHRVGNSVLALAPGNDATADGASPASLSQLSTRVENFTNLASLPAAGQAGRIAYVVSDLAFYLDNGTNWQIASSGGAKTFALESYAAAAEIALSTTDLVQFRPIQSTGGAVALSTTPFGSTVLKDGTEVILVGASDTDTVSISWNDSAKGCVGDFSVLEFPRYRTQRFIYSALFDRYVLVGGSNV